MANSSTDDRAVRTARQKIQRKSERHDRVPCSNPLRPRSANSELQSVNQRSLITTPATSPTRSTSLNNRGTLLKPSPEKSMSSSRSPTSAVYVKLVLWSRLGGATCRHRRRARWPGGRRTSHAPFRRACSRGWGWLGGANRLARRNSEPPSETCTAARPRSRSMLRSAFGSCASRLSRSRAASSSARILETLARRANVSRATSASSSARSISCSDSQPLAQSAQLFGLARRALRAAARRLVVGVRAARPRARARAIARARAPWREPRRCSASHAASLP